MDQNSTRYYQLSAKGLAYVKDAMLNLVNKYKYMMDEESYTDMISYNMRSMNANGFYTERQREWLLNQHAQGVSKISLYEVVKTWHKNGLLTNLQNTDYFYKDYMPSYRTLLYLLDEGFRCIDLTKRNLQNVLYKKYGKKCPQWKVAQKSIRKVENQYKKLVIEAHTETGIILDNNLNIVEAKIDNKLEQILKRIESGRYSVLTDWTSYIRLVHRNNSNYDCQNCKNRMYISDNFNKYLKANGVRWDGLVYQLNCYDDLEKFKFLLNEIKRYWENYSQYLDKLYI